MAQSYFYPAFKSKLCNFWIWQFAFRYFNLVSALAKVNINNKCNVTAHGKFATELKELHHLPGYIHEYGSEVIWKK